jgi:hypothetical protein
MKRKEKLSSKERQRRAIAQARIEGNRESMDALHQLNKFTLKWKKKQGDIKQNEEYQKLFAASAEADHQLILCWAIERSIDRRIAKLPTACASRSQRCSERRADRKDV